MTTLEDETRTYLEPLIGLKLLIARRAGEMRCFQFGPVRRVEGDAVRAYALHIQCPWRLEDPYAIVTGCSDLREPAELDEKTDWDDRDCDQDRNLQDERVGALLGGCDLKTRSFVNVGDELVVEGIEAGRHGGATIVLSGGYRLVLFPAGGRGEDWRIFQHELRRSHFVIAGGKCESKPKLAVEPAAPVNRR